MSTMFMDNLESLTTEKINIELTLQTISSVLRFNQKNMETARDPKVGQLQTCLLSIFASRR